MNAKQRRRFVRQYKKAIKLDQVVCRLEGTTRWFDPVTPSFFNEGKNSPELTYIYARYLHSKDKRNADSSQQTL